MTMGGSYTIGKRIPLRKKPYQTNTSKAGSAEPPPPPARPQRPVFAMAGALSQYSLTEVCALEGPLRAPGGEESQSSGFSEEELCAFV